MGVGGKSGSSSRRRRKKVRKSQQSAPSFPHLSSSSNPRRKLTLPYMTYSHSSAMLPSMPALHPPSPSFSPSGSRLEASAKEKVVEGVMGRRSVLICGGGEREKLKGSAAG